jgi:HlyD family secretion protein
MKKGNIIAIVIILIFTGIGLLNYIRFKSEKGEKVEVEQKVPVHVVEAGVKSLKRTLGLTGEIRPIRGIDLFPKIPGRIIRKIAVEKGDYVRKGDLIAVLEQDVIKAKIDEAEASIESARAALSQVETRLETLRKDRLRLENLYKEKAVAKQRLDHIVAEYEDAKAGRRLALARIERARAVLGQLSILQREHSIYAPISGFVTARYVEEGAITSSGQPIIRISDEAKVKIVTTVSERFFHDIKKGMRADISVDAFPGKLFTGKITIKTPSIDPSSRTAEIEIHLLNNDLLLRSGMFAHIKLYLSDKSAVVIPRDALNRLPGTGNFYVYVVEDGRAVLKNIKTGLSEGNLVEVTDGINTGEQVVVKGQNRLKDGTMVVVVEKAAI